MDPREWMFDKRVVRRNLDKGVLAWKSYKEHLKGLDNVEGEAEVLEIDPRAHAGGTGADSEG